MAGVAGRYGTTTLCRRSGICEIGYFLFQGYSIGQAPRTLYRVTGSSDDWARGGAAIK
jgi:hypothetical protein